MARHAITTVSNKGTREKADTVDATSCDARSLAGCFVMLTFLLFASGFTLQEHADER